MTTVLRKLPWVEWIVTDRKRLCPKCKRFPAGFGVSRRKAEDALNQIGRCRHRTGGGWWQGGELLGWRFAR